MGTTFVKALCSNPSGGGDILERRERMRVGFVVEGLKMAEMGVFRVKGPYIEGPDTSAKIADF